MGNLFETKKVKNALIKLDDIECEIIKLRYHNDKTQSEVSKLLNIPIKRIKLLEKFAINKLRVYSKL